MSSKGILSVFLLFFLNTLTLKAQSFQKEKKLLTSVLKTLENKYNLNFTYADLNVKNIEITPPKSNLPVKEAILFLQKETKLDFEVLDERYIVIKKRRIAKTKYLTQRLDEVIVTNYLTSGITKLNDGSINIKPESFGILPGLIEPDVLQTIQALPGVLSIDETVSNINVRGGTHDQNLLLWDGIKMYHSGHFFGLISAFNPYVTKSINIYKNGTSSKYGDGISSIIDMRLPDAIDNTFSAGAGFNLINADGFAKIPLNHNSELQVSLRRSLTDLIETPTYNQYSKRAFQDTELTNFNQNENFSFHDITLKFLYNLSKKDKLRFHFINASNNLDFEEQSTVNDKEEILNSKLSQQNTALSFTYTRDWNKKLSTTAQIYVSNYDLDATNFDITNNQRLIQENEVYDGSAKLEINYTPTNTLKIEGGYQFTETGISNLEDVSRPIFRSFIKQVVRSHSVYAEGSFLPKNANTNLRFGTRVNYIQKLDALLVEPRLSFSQRFFNYFKFQLLAELKSQTTSQIIDLQNDFLGVEKRRWVLSNNKNTINPDIGESYIPIIKSKQISTGISYKKNNLLVSVETYLKNVDGITTQSQGFQNQYQFVKAIGQYKIKGIDFLINKQFSNILSTWLSYSYSKSNYSFNTLNNGDIFPNNSDIRHALSLSGAYTYNDFKLALGLNWHSGKPTTLPDYEAGFSDGVITYQKPNTSNLNDYLRTDCSATYRFDISNKTDAIIGASIWNLLDKKNIINTYYTLDANNNITKVENQSLGITPNVSFRLRF
ncbi:carboxypeptidase-like regulatory domain-containing protein [Postechiella marina]|uniref:Carboxypeptidase-like regulatory domain-containing protein n=1 Tax=Postechiella marina TaxID=943941 RepID=A0ABP8CAB3_9FLAO